MYMWYKPLCEIFMPLMKSKSKQAFTHNLKAEMHAGKPQNQALAIAYATKRGAARKASGGEIMNQSNNCSACYAMGGLCEYHSNNGDSLIDADAPKASSLPPAEGPLSQESKGNQGKYAYGGNVELEEADKHNPLSLSELALQKRHLDAMDRDKYAQGGPVNSYPKGAEGYDKFADGGWAGRMAADKEQVSVGRPNTLSPIQDDAPSLLSFTESDSNDFKNRDDISDPEHDSGAVDELEDESLSGMAMKRRKMKR